MSVRVVEQHVAGSDGDVKIRRDDGIVTVTWFCGDTRKFTPDELKSAINYVEKLKPVGGVWLRHRDHHGSGYAVLVVDGELYADRAEVDTDVIPELNHVPWESFRKALKTAAS